MARRDVAERGWTWLGEAGHGHHHIETDQQVDLSLTIIGTSPLLMHNSRLSNPLDPMARAMKKISAKRNKSEADHEELAHLEFLGSLYADGDVGPYVPADNIFRMLVDAAKKRKLGVVVTSGVMVRSDVNPLAYSGPRDPEELWGNGNFTHQASVKVGQSRVIRTRPVFKAWKTEASLYLDTEILDLDDLTQLIDIGGRLVGLGDWRPRFGRFEGELTVVKEKS